MVLEKCFIKPFPLYTPLYSSPSLPKPPSPSLDVTLKMLLLFRYFQVHVSFSD